MQLTIDLWQFLGIQAAFATAFGGALLKIGHVLLNAFVKQFEARLDERFKVTEKNQADHVEAFHRSISKIDIELRGLERGQAAIREEMLREYVRREDAIRDQTVTQAKLDALSARLELLMQSMARYMAATEGRQKS